VTSVTVMQLLEDGCIACDRSPHLVIGAFLRPGRDQHSFGQRCRSGNMAGRSLNDGAADTQPD